MRINQKDGLYVVHYNLNIGKTLRNQAKSPFSAKLDLKKVSLKELWISQVIDVFKLYDNLISTGFLIASVSTENIYYGLDLQNNPIGMAHVPGLLKAVRNISTCQTVGMKFPFYNEQSKSPLGIRDDLMAIGMVMCEVIYGDKKSSPEFLSYIEHPQKEWNGEPRKFLNFLLPKIEMVIGNEVTRETYNWLEKLADGFNVELNELVRDLEK